MLNPRYSVITAAITPSGGRVGLAFVCEMLEDGSDVFGEAISVSIQILPVPINTSMHYRVHGRMVTWGGGVDALLHPLRRCICCVMQSVFEDAESDRMEFRLLKPVHHAVCLEHPKYESTD